MTEIEIYQGRSPRLRGADVRVVIDVIRAFTTTHVALVGGADEIVLAGSLAEARRLAADSPRRLLAGERGAVAPPDFDLGNSPAEFAEADLEGRRLVLTTSNGVQATLHAMGRGPVVVTGFSNAGATVEYLRGQIGEGADRIELIASDPAGDEDIACAQWMRARLQGGTDPTDREVVDRIRDSDNAEKFLDEARPEFRADDIDFCARRDDARWVMRAVSTHGDIAVEPEATG